MIKRYFILLFLLIYSAGSCQIIESDKLLLKSFENVFIEPDETLKIASHLKKGESSDKKAEAFLLAALAFYSKGDYENSLIDAFEAKKIATENYNEKILFESIRLIASLLNIVGLDEADNYLKLISKDYQSNYLLRNDLSKKDCLNKLIKLNSMNDNLKVQIYLNLSDIYLSANKSDSAKYFAEKAASKTNNIGGLWKVEALKLKGQILFQQKKNDAAILVLEDALNEAVKINNPFLQLEIHRKLAASHLAAGNKEKYQKNYQKSLALINKTEQVENAAISKAHQIITQEWDQQLSKESGRINTYFIITLVFAISMILVVIATYFVHKNKVKTYKSLFAFLNESKTKEPTKTERKQVVLKESEMVILAGLDRFENSGDFTNKDMSLGMLASQLGTNTKYLSEVINRNKGKNFKSYINELRIRYIAEKIKNDPNYLNYKISYLAEESGFTLHSTFTSIFKSIVGLSPIAFIEIVKEERQTKKISR